MRWMRAAGRRLLILGIVLTGCVSSAGPVGGDEGRGPLTLATAGDLTGYLDTVLGGGTARTRERG